MQGQAQERSSHWRTWASPSDIRVFWLLHHLLRPPEQRYSLVHGSAKDFLIKLLLGCFFCVLSPAGFSQPDYPPRKFLQPEDKVVPNSFSFAPLRHCSTKKPK